MVSSKLDKIVLSCTKTQNVNSLLGISVTTWDGEQTELGQEAARDARDAKKRKWDDDYEEELDSGRVSLKQNHY